MGRNFKFGVCAVTIAVLASCGPTGDSIDDVQDANAVANTAANIGNEEAVGTTISFKPVELLSSGNAPDTVSVSGTDDFVEVVALDGYDMGNPGGTIPNGFTIKLGPEIEQQLSGKKITVEIDASGGAFQVAYSTNEVGNSGWRSFQSGERETVSFEYQLNEIQAGNNDFIGIAPSGEQPTQIFEVRIVTDS